MRSVNRLKTELMTTTEVIKYLTNLKTIPTTPHTRTIVSGHEKRNTLQNKLARREERVIDSVHCTLGGVQKHSFEKSFDLK